jgi:hypothetical protein
VYKCSCKECYTYNMIFATQFLKSHTNYIEPQGRPPPSTEKFWVRTWHLGICGGLICTTVDAIFIICSRTGTAVSVLLVPAPFSSLKTAHVIAAAFAFILRQDCCPYFRQLIYIYVYIKIESFNSSLQMSPLLRFSASSSGVYCLEQ